MVALRTTPLNRRITLGGQSPTAIYLLLFSGGYLSWKGLQQRAAVTALIKEVIWTWKRKDPRPIGIDLSGLVADSLAGGNYLSWWARIWGSRSVARGYGL